MRPLPLALRITLGAQCLAMAAPISNAAEIKNDDTLELASPASLQQELNAQQERVDGLKQRINSLEAQQFSPTTRMTMLVRSSAGGVNYSGNQINATANTWGQGEGAINLRNALTVNYDIMLFLDTSTTGKDLLRTILRMGNFGKSAFGVSGSGSASNPIFLTQLDEGFEDPKGSNIVDINRLFYSTPINQYATVVFGPRLRQNDALPVWPTIYARPGSELLLKIFTQAGSTSAYSLLIGPGAGLILKNRDQSAGWSAGINYIAFNGFRGNPDDSVRDPGGMGSSGSAATAMAQASYTGQGWNLSLAAAQNGTGVRQDGTNFWRRLQPQFGSADQRQAGYNNKGITRAISLAGYWQPRRSGLIPSISAGVGFNQANLTNSSIQINRQPLKSIQSAGWLVGFTWDDAFASGNQFGAAIGQPTFVTSVNNEQAKDSNYAFEVYYKIQATDRIIITPALFYLSHPRGADTQAPGMPASPSPSFNALGALVEFTLKI